VVFEGIKELRVSIAREGLIYPLEVEEMPDGTYLLLDGARRLHALRELDPKTIPCIIEARREGAFHPPAHVRFSQEQAQHRGAGRSFREAHADGPPQEGRQQDARSVRIHHRPHHKVLRFNDRTRALIVSGAIKKSTYDELVKTRAGKPSA
jgi:hypothetical protein